MEEKYKRVRCVVFTFSTDLLNIVDIIEGVPKISAKEEWVLNLRQEKFEFCIRIRLDINYFT